MRGTDSERVAAFQRLAEQRLDASYRLANAILGDATQAQDTVHDAVLIAWKRWSSLRDPAKFDAWFDRYFPRVYGYVARRVGAAADARELTREILGAALVDLPGGLDDEALDLCNGAQRVRVLSSRVCQLLGAQLQRARSSGFAKGIQAVRGRKRSARAGASAQAPRQAPANPSPRRA